MDELETAIRAHLVSTRPWLSEDKSTTLWNLLDNPPPYETDEEFVAMIEYWIELSGAPVTSVRNLCAAMYCETIDRTAKMFPELVGTGSLPISDTVNRCGVVMRALEGRRQRDKRGRFV